MMFSRNPTKTISIIAFLALIFSLLAMPIYNYDLIWGVGLMLICVALLHAYCIAFKQDYTLLLLVVALASLRVLLAFYDSQIAILPGMEKDPISFYLQTISLMKTKTEYDVVNGSLGFKMYLVYVYTFLGEDRFSGNIMSVICSCFALILFYECLSILNAHYKKTMLFIFGMHVSFFMYSAVTIRESYLVLFVLIFTYFSLLSFVYKKHSLIYFTLALLSLLLLPIFHVKAFYLYSLSIGVVFLVTYIYLKKDDLISKKIRFLTILVLVLPLVVMFKGGEFNSILNSKWAGAETGTPLSSLNGYLYLTQERVDARTKFKTVLDTTSVLTAVKTAPISFYYYMTEPMPWNYRNDVRDLVPMAESIFRVFALMVMFLYFMRFVVNAKVRLQKVNQSIEKYYVFPCYLFLIYLGQCAIWSLGSANYGQAFRHHVPALPLLMLCLAVVLTNMLGGSYLLLNKKERS